MPRLFRLVIALSLLLVTVMVGGLIRHASRQTSPQSVQAAAPGTPGTQGISAIPRNPVTLAVTPGVARVPTTAPASDGAALIIRPEHATPILPLAQVKIGMKGYGLTVIHGTTIEPLLFEVVSVMRDFGPKKGVIWVRCPEEKMQKTGPVAGMSGSPMYLWDENEPQVPGQGGRLIGAFAFGYEATRDCYVGIQPIEAMYDVNSRLSEDPDARKAGKSNPDPAAKGQAAGGHPYTLLRQLAASLPAAPKTTPETHAGMDRYWRTRLLAQTLLTPDAAGEPVALSIPSPDAGKSQVSPMLLPMTLRSPGLAAMMAPFLAPAGIAPMQSSAQGVAGLPPPEIAVDRITLRPGSVLSIPLAFGDLDLSAQGTVTDVLPDGRVLAFGHAMFGEGDVKLPMATGYVHYIVPGLISSFKLGGSGQIVGSVLRDENSAIAGAGVVRYTTAPLAITVKRPDQPVQTYHYQLAHHKTLTPVLAAIVAIESLQAQSNLPEENTLHLTGKLTFAGGRELPLDLTMAGAYAMDVAFAIMPTIAVMSQNPFEEVLLQGAELTVEVKDEMKVATILDARLDSADLHPGDTANVTLRMQPHHGEIFSQTIRLKIPATLPEGSYELQVGGADMYASAMWQSRPHLRVTQSVDDVLAVTRMMNAIQGNALYAVLELPTQGLAIGRQEMPQLPSSQRALIATPTNSRATDFTDWVTARQKVDYQPIGRTQFTLTITRLPSP